MTREMTIRAQRHTYQVTLRANAYVTLAPNDGRTRHAVVDRRVRALHAEQLSALSKMASVLEVDADEHAKSLDRFPDYVEHLVAANFRRNDILVAVGGGVIQDITAFLASTMMRGLDWEFHPTTLLAQTDSCIGSKSSINVGRVKNILGTFHPPIRVEIGVDALRTLQNCDIRSGIGEMIKAHVIAGAHRFDQLAKDFQNIQKDAAYMERYVWDSLEIKKPFVEEDEFDRARRNIFNYGHSFGHALEAATDFGVPHGIAVAMGMDIANFVAARTGRITDKDFDRMHPIMSATYRGYEETPVPLQKFMDALSHDKKNVGSMLTLILPGEQSAPEKVQSLSRDVVENLCQTFFREVRAA